MPRRHVRIIFACLALAATLPAAAAAAQGRCPQPGGAVGPARSQAAEAGNRHGVDGGAAADVARGSRRPRTGARHLSRANCAPACSFSSASRSTACQACLALREAAIEVELADRRILLARELQRGTCRYDVTLAHEQLHARIDETVLARELPKMKAAIARAVQENGAVGPIRAADVDSLPR